MPSHQLTLQIYGLEVFEFIFNLYIITSNRIINIITSFIINNNAEFTGFQKIKLTRLGTNRNTKGR
jgi:hypothetical protein